MKRRIASWFFLFALVAACVSNDAAPVTDSAPPVSDSAAVACPAGESLAIDLTTDDDVVLIADLYVSQNPLGGPAVILLHMIPPSNTKANYPVAFAEALQDRGFTVLNVNRRGAPGSGGNAMDAYVGPLGKLDAKAAYDYLKSECGMSWYSIIGASNGTTTTVDFAVHAAETATIDVPASIIGLSGGSYTESQNSIAGNMVSLPAGALFAYPSSEATWNEGIQGIAPNWEFIEYSPGAHGTGLITTNPEITDAILDFLDPPV